MICGNAALLYESRDESNGRKLKFSRSMVDRFHRDSSLDRATHLREAQRRRAGYLSDLKRRDQDQQRGRRYSANPSTGHADETSEQSDASLVDILEASAGVQQNREVYDQSSRALATGSHSSPRFSRPQSRTLYPTRPSTTPATVAAGRAKSPSRLAVASCSKENRQAATERAVRVYSAGAGIAKDGRRNRSPAKPLPAWDDRSPSPSSVKSQRQRMSPREHGRRPVEATAVGKAGKGCSEVPVHGGKPRGASNGLSEWRRRPVRPATGGRPSKRFSRPISAFAGRWDGDESFPEEPPKSLLSEEREVDYGELARAEGCPAELKPNFASKGPPKGRACSPPAVDLRRAHTAEETPSIQRARQLELQRLAIEKKELQAQLAEVKQLMRASKVRARAVSGSRGTLGAAVNAESPGEPRGRTLARRSRHAGGNTREEQRRGSGSADPPMEEAGVAPCELEKSRRRGKGEAAFTEGGRDRPAAGDARDGCENARPGEGSGEGDESSRRRRRRRKRKRSCERGRSRSRKRQPQALGRRSVASEIKVGRRSASDHSPTTLVAFNTCVSVNRPAAVEWLQGVCSPRENSIACTGGYTGTRRLRRPKSASRRSWSAPRQSMERAGAAVIARGDREAAGGSVVRREATSTSPSRVRRPASRASRERNKVDRFAAVKGRVHNQDGRDRRVNFAQFPATKLAKTRTPTSSCREDIEKSYADDFEAVSARDSYASDFDTCGDSESPHGPFEGEHMLTRDGSRRSRAPRGSGVEKQGNRTWSAQQKSAAASRGRNGVDPTTDSFLRDGENWIDGHQHGRNSRVNDGGAASWAEWNQPDQGSGDFASSRGWNTGEREAAAAAAAAIHPGSRKDAHGFDHLWVDGCDNVLGVRAEGDIDTAAGPRRADGGQGRTLDGSLSSSYEEYSAETAGGPSSLACPPGLIDGGHDHRSLRAKAGEEGGASTASVSDGGVSLFDVRLSSRDDSYSDETWSLESHDRRDDTASPAELDVTAAARGTGPRTMRRHSAAAGASSDGSSLYDVTSQASDRATSPRTIDDPSVPPGDGTTGNDAAALGGSGKVIRPVVAAEDEIWVERAVEAQQIPSHNRGVERTESSEGLRTSSGPLTIHGSGTEKQLFESNESSFDHLHLETSPSGALGIENSSFGEEREAHVVGNKQLNREDSTDRPFIDEYFGSSAESTKIGLDYKQAGPDESLDELSSLEKQGAAAHEKLEEGGASSDERFNSGSAENMEMNESHEKGDKPAEPEESLHDFSSFEKQDEANREKVEEGGTLVDAYFNSSAESIEMGQGHEIDDKPAEPEESLDELSSLEKQVEAHAVGNMLLEPEGSADMSLACGVGEASVDEYLNGSWDSVEMGQAPVTVYNKPAEPEESLDELSSLEKRDEAHAVDTKLPELEDSTERLLAEGGGEAPLDEYSDNNPAEPEESLDELSSLEKRDEAYAVDTKLPEPGGPTETPLVAGGGEASLDEYFDGSAESVEMGQARVIDNKPVEPEESLDELSSLEKRDEAHVVDTKLPEPGGPTERPLVAGGGEVSLDEYFDGSSESIEIAQARVVDNKPAEPEESLDELSSLEKHGEANRAKLEDGGASVDAYLDGGSAVSIEIGRSHEIGTLQVEPQESLDELSSLEKQGEAHVMDNQLLDPEDSIERPPARGRGEASLDEYFDGSAGSREMGQDHVTDNKQHELEESLDELSSLEKQDEASREKLEEGGASVDEYFNSGSVESIEVDQSHAIDNVQVEPEESLDELSSLEKQGESSRANLEEGEASVDAYFNSGSGESIEVDQSHAKDNVQVKPEESLDELSSLEKQGESSRERSEAAGASVDAYINSSAGGRDRGQERRCSQLEAEELTDELAAPANSDIHENRADQQQQQQQRQRQRQQQGVTVDSHSAKRPFLRASGNEPFEQAPAVPPVNGKDESLDEHLFEGGTASYEDLLSLSGSSFDGDGRSPHGEGVSAIDGDGSSSIEKHSLDQHFGALSSSGGGSPPLSDGMSLGGSTMSDFGLGGSSSEGVANSCSSWEIP